MTYRRVHNFWDPILNSEKVFDLEVLYFYIHEYNITSKVIFRVLTVYQKSSSSGSSKSSEEDIKELKRKKRYKEEKSLKLKTLLNIHVKLCNI